MRFCSEDSVTSSCLSSLRVPVSCNNMLFLLISSKISLRNSFAIDFICCRSDSATGDVEK